MAGYVYGAARRLSPDVAGLLSRLRPVVVVEPVDACGDFRGRNKGVLLHRRASQPRCVPCDRYEKAKEAARREKRPRNPRKPRPLLHGTWQGYEQERRQGLEICNKCRDAYNLKARERRLEAKKRKAGK